MRERRLSRNTRKGFVLIYYTLCLGVMLPIVGLAIDLGMLYSIRAKLTSAIDASALAAGRCLSRGISFTNAKPVAIDTGKRFFLANFPDGYWGSKLNPGSPTITLDNPVGQMVIDVKADVTVPLLFMRILRFPDTLVASSAQAVRRNVNLVLVLDRSSSIHNAGADKDVRDSAKNFVGRMVERQDQVGLVSFDGNVHNHFTPQLVFQAQAYAAIEALAFTGWTNSAGGLHAAYKMLQDLGEPGAHNVIVFFTDGRPTALSAQFRIKTQADQRYGFSNGYNNNDLWMTLNYNAAPGTCVALPYIQGFIAASQNFNPEPAATGVTSGIFADTWLDTSYNTDTDKIAPGLSSSTCWTGYTAYTRGGSPYKVNNWDTTNYRAFIAYIPDTDVNGYNTSASSGYYAPETFPAGHKYAGRIRPDSPRALRYAAYNAVDSCAKKIRADLTIRPIVYTIGLGGTNSQEPIDDVLLERLANDPRSPIFDSSAPQGKYAKAKDTTELQAAFDEIASQILRLSQ